MRKLRGAEWELEAAVGDAEVQARKSQRDVDVSRGVGLHFAHIGEEMTCTRPNLPFPPAGSLAEDSDSHAGDCSRGPLPQCLEDLESLRELDLRPGNSRD